VVGHQRFGRTRYLHFQGKGKGGSAIHFTLKTEVIVMGKIIGQAEREQNLRWRNMMSKIEGHGS
jgi:hypothetical protein